MLTKSRVAQLLFMMVVLVGLFFWRTFDQTAQRNVEVEQNITPKIDLLRCDYKQACEFITEQGVFLLSVKNIPVIAEEWIDFELTSPLENSDIIDAKIVGKNMFMGRIPVRFEKIEDKKFIARSLVGACTTDEMIWQLQIEIKTGDALETLLFDFMVKK